VHSWWKRIPLFGPLFMTIGPQITGSSSCPVALKRRGAQQPRKYLLRTTLHYPDLKPWMTSSWLLDCLSKVVFHSWAHITAFVPSIKLCICKPKTFGVFLGKTLHFWDQYIVARLTDVSFFLPCSWHSTHFCFLAVYISSKVNREYFILTFCYIFCRVFSTISNY